MGYTTPAQLVMQFGSQELSQISVTSTGATPVLVTGVLLELVINGDPDDLLDNYTDEQTAAATAALARITDQIENASQEMDSYIRVRHTLPLSDATIAASPLDSFCGDLVRFRLMRDFGTPEVDDRYK